MKAHLKPRIEQLNNRAHRVPHRHRQLALVELLLASAFLAFALYGMFVMPLDREKAVFALVSVVLVIINMSYLFTFIDTFFERREAHRLP